MSTTRVVKKKRPRLLKTTLAIDVEAKEKFREYFPQKGALQWFVNECLKTFERIHDPKVGQEIEDVIRRVTTLGYKEPEE